MTSTPTRSLPRPPGPAPRIFAAVAASCLVWAGCGGGAGRAATGGTSGTNVGGGGGGGGGDGDAAAGADARPDATPAAGAVLGTFSLSPESGVGRYSVALDALGNVWVAKGYTMVGSNVGNLTKLSPDGSVLATFTVANGGADVAPGTGGEMWVTTDPYNSLNSGVTKLSNDGAVLGSFKAFDVPNGTFTPPFLSRAVADGSGGVYLLNNISDAVRRLGSDGAAAGTAAIEAFDHGCMTLSPSGDVWVAESNPVRYPVYRLGPDLAVRSRYDNLFSGINGGVVGCAADPSGNLWIAFSSSVVRKIGQDGTPLGTFAMPNPGEITAIAAAGSGGGMLVSHNARTGGTDAGYNQYTGYVYRLSPEGEIVGATSLGSLGSNMLGRLAVDASGNAWAVLGIVNEGSGAVLKVSP